MAEERPTTPEKQLLKLIEDPKAQGSSQQKIRRRPLSLFSLSALRGRLSFLVEKLRRSFAFKKGPVDVKTINNILKLCIAVLIISLTGNFIHSMMNLKKIPDFVLESSRAPVKTAAAAISLKNASYYLEKTRARDIFHFGGEQITEEVTKKEVLQPQEHLHKITDDLGLVGIGWSEDPDVMIENTKSQKMYFLKRGQWIDGKIKIEAVFKDKVILSYEGEEIELR